MNIDDSIQMTDNSVNIHNFDELQAVLKRYCLSLTKSNWDAEELAQNTWVKALGKLNNFEHTNPKALLLRIAKNTWIDEIRRKAVFTRILNREQAKVTEADHGTFEIEIALQSLMNHLSPLQRTVFLLRDVFAFSISETSDILGTTEGAVKVALHRARKSLGAVQEELLKGELSLPESEKSKTFLRALTAAYQMGDIATLVMLSYQDVMEPDVMIGIVNNKLLWSHISAKQTNFDTLSMMAA
ncbi:RNA polymerase sigma factor [Paenibacillus sp. P2(2022)]|uniref:RNA polymerase sigma factor n=1 Tax=Paenibacillus TaxID=44249 RepID=UPI0005EC775E|nr:MULTISPECIES: RNA polymerase sigma factor [Paenibacillus]AUS26583.1 DNA-directed RNA polymerase subunit sigma [Paenibacillus polymyxa]KJK28720.1 DNA-directed RNA polymerase subunit sigma [Paenibacillus polymyxa]MDG0056418.1 RNA polymerase sigma factor [Paenibacillus sp. P2(2022)]SEK05681.1 RNA polymerase sigma-70 factor, ECF subfamily [Paenibacillus polymyxa]